MKKAILKIRASIVLAIITAAAIALPVFANAIWLTVNPGNQTTSSQAAWQTTMGKEPGCPETDLKLRVLFGDGVSSTGTGMRACYPYVLVHYYNSSGNYTQRWYVGKGSGGFFYLLSTTARKN
jgi:hypothetical protein